MPAETTEKEVSIKKSPRRFAIKRLYILSGPETRDQFSIEWERVSKNHKDSFTYCLREARQRNMEHLLKYLVVETKVAKKATYEDIYSYRMNLEDKGIKKRRLSRKQVNKLFGICDS